MVDIKEFLNPKATLTPGFAGGVVMAIANSLWVAFELPQAWTALAVSSLVALLVVAANPAPLWQRLIYWVLNALVIFSVGAGGNALGRGAARAADIRPSAAFQLAGAATAYAQPRETARPEQDLQKQREEIERRERELQRREQELQRKTEGQQKKEKAMPEQRPRQFFDRWF